MFGFFAVVYLQEYLLSNSAKKVLEPHGITIHSLRHTYAYLLKSKGVHVTTAQRLLGHSDPKVTLAIYTQVLDTEIDDTGALLKSFIGDEKAEIGRNAAYRTAS